MMINPMGTQRPDVQELNAQENQQQADIRTAERMRELEARRALGTSWSRRRAFLSSLAVVLALVVAAVLYKVLVLR